MASPEDDKDEVLICCQLLCTYQRFNNMDELLHFVPADVTTEMNNAFSKPFEDGEVRKALSNGAIQSSRY